MAIELVVVAALGGWLALVVEGCGVVVDKSVDPIIL